MKPFEHLVVYDDGVVRVAQDWVCPIPGFMILSTVEPIRTLAELSDGDAQRLGLVLAETRAALLELGFEDTYLFENDGSNSPFHVWMLPRHGWMDGFIDELPDLKAILRRSKEVMHLTPEVEETAERVRERLRQTI